MINDLEGISFDGVIDAGGVSYGSFRKTLVPDYRIITRDIVSGYCFLALSCLVIFRFQTIHPAWHFVSVLIGGLIIGYGIAYLMLFVHEAGHFGLHPNHGRNDLLASIFLCSWIGLSIKSYRSIHWQHHRCLGLPEDTESSYFHPLTRQFLIESLTGAHLIRKILQRDTHTGAAPKREGVAMLLIGALLHSSILLVGFRTGHWPFAVTWVLAFGIFFPFFASLRQILEHRCEEAGASENYYQQPRRKTARLFETTLLSYTFGPAGFTRHLLHHYDPQVSYTRLGDVEKFLGACPLTEADIAISRTSYLAALRRLVART